MHRFLSVACALSAMHVLGALAQDVPTCVASCASQVRADFTQFKCANADDAGCLCPSADFSNGIRDCGSATCGATDADVQAYLKPDFCLNFALPSAASSTDAATTAKPTTTTEAPTTTAAPSTTKAESTTKAPSTTEIPSTTTKASAKTTEKAKSETTSAPSSTEATTSASVASTSATSSATTSSAAATDAAAADGSKDDNSSSGLSEGAKIGIAVGVTVGAIAIALVCLCLFVRNRRRTPQPRQHPLEISKPLPGSGPTYGSGGRSSYEKYQADIEMTSNRYDDMPPRQVPRTMV